MQRGGSIGSLADVLDQVFALIEDGLNYPAIEATS
jgi:hypothetical protein